MSTTSSPCGTNSSTPVPESVKTTIPLQPYMDTKPIVRGIIVGLACIVAGAFIGINISSSVAEGSAQETLSAYPVDLSMAGLHRHDRRNVPAENAPNVELTAAEDPMMPGHFNLRIDTDNFQFAPENVSSKFVIGEGHAHIFVDDVKISRAYDSYYHLPRLDPGKHTIKVTLNTNNHQEYAVDGATISDSVQVRVADDAPRMNMSMNGNDMDLSDK